MIRFDVPAYQTAMTEFAQSVLRGMAALDPTIGQVQREPTVHAGPTRNVPGSQPVDHPMFRLEPRAVIPEDVVRHGRFDDYATALVGMAAEFRDQVTGQLSRALGDVTNATGNTVDGGGRPLSHDLIFDALERVEIDFDDEGTPLLPDLMMNPKTADALARLEPTPEQRRRRDDILARKRAAHDAEKRTRRLPG